MLYFTLCGAHLSQLWNTGQPSRIYSFWQPVIQATSTSQIGLQDETWESLLLHWPFGHCTGRWECSGSVAVHAFAFALLCLLIPLQSWYKVPGFVPDSNERLMAFLMVGFCWLPCRAHLDITRQAPQKVEVFWNHVRMIHSEIPRERY